VLHPRPQEAGRRCGPGGLAGLAGLERACSGAAGDGGRGACRLQRRPGGTTAARRINEIVHGQRRITADTALRLSRYFGTSERFWLNLQARYDLETEKDRLGAALDDIRPPSAAS
jgi:hypothetical protein